VCTKAATTLMCRDSSHVLQIRRHRPSHLGTDGGTFPKGEPPQFVHVDGKRFTFHPFMRSAALFAALSFDSLR